MAGKKTTAKQDAFAMNGYNADAFQDGFEKMTQGVSEFAKFQQQSFEAIMESAGAFAKGVERAATEHTAFVKEFYEEGVEVAQKASSSKSVQEALELQNEFARTAIEMNLGQATKVSEHWAGVAKETTDPLTKRYNDFVELVQTFRP